MNAPSQITQLLQLAQQAGENGDLKQAEKLLENVLHIDKEHISALTMLGQVFCAQNKYEDASDYLNRAIHVSPPNPWLHYEYGKTLEKTERVSQSAKSYLNAWKLDKTNARFALFAGAAFYQSGKREQALQIWSLGTDIDPMVRAAHQNPQADAQTREKSRLADMCLREFFSAQHQTSLEKARNPARMQSSLWPQTHNQAFNYSNPSGEETALKPYVFYAPDLPRTPVFAPPSAPWAQRLQNGTDIIRSEYLNFMDTKHSFRKPYIHTNAVVDASCNHLRGQETWTAVHLYKDGVAQECLEHFPNTRDILKGVPLVKFHGEPMEVFFSILKPGIHIPPHFGLANTRVTAHLPLIIPKDTCRIRVAEHMHHWTEGELFMFDDSFNHEAWNDSRQTRVVLIFEAWRPDLTKQEIQAIKASFEDRDNWLKNRSVPTIESLND